MVAGRHEIVFFSDRTENVDVYVMNADGTDAKRLTDDPAIDGLPVWSRDRTMIAFVSERDGNPEIYVMSADGTGVRRVTDDAAEEAEPAWAPIRRPCVRVPCPLRRRDGRQRPTAQTRRVDGRFPPDADLDASWASGDRPADDQVSALGHRRNDHGHE